MYQGSTAKQETITAAWVSKWEEVFLLLPLMRGQNVRDPSPSTFLFPTFLHKYSCPHRHVAPHMLLSLSIEPHSHASVSLLPSYRLRMPSKTCDITVESCFCAIASPSSVSLCFFPWHCDTSDRGYRFGLPLLSSLSVEPGFFEWAPHWDLRVYENGRQACTVAPEVYEY